MSYIKAVNIRFSDKLHKALKIHVINKEQSIQDYVISLVKKDMNFKDEDDDLSDYSTIKK